MAAIVKIFRDLKGGKIESVDYADKWRRTCLESSEIVVKWQDEGFNNAYEYWRTLDGCWQQVFIRFWTLVRDQLADKDNDEAWHYWGNPKQSNIFNKTHLTILASDFFQYLCERRLGIDDVSDITNHVDGWLEGVNRNYFNRDWDLHSLKKDLSGIQKQWSYLWTNYRKDPQKLPKSTLYKITRS